MNFRIRFFVYTKYTVGILSGITLNVYPRFEWGFCFSGFLQVPVNFSSETWGWGSVGRRQAHIPLEDAPLLPPPELGVGCSR